MPTLTANPAMRARLEKAGPPLPHPAARHATAPKPPKPPPAEVDPEVAARHRAAQERKRERRNALWARLTVPVLFDTVPAPPMVIRVHDLLVERLGLDAAGERDLSRIIRFHVNRPAYQKSLAAPGSVRLDLDGRPTGEVTDEQRAWAAIKRENLKAQLKAKAARDGAGQ